MQYLKQTILLTHCFQIIKYCHCYTRLLFSSGKFHVHGYPEPRISLLSRHRPDVGVG